MIDLLDDGINSIMNSSNIKTFGLIIYTEENSNIVKLLRDDDHWNSLSSISGEKFFVFTVKPKKGSFSIPAIKSGTLGFIQQIWNEPNDNKKILELFEIDSTRNLPLFFVFTKVGTVLWKHKIKIDDTNVDTALKQLKEVFYKIREVSEKANPDKNDESYIHGQFSEILKKHNFFKITSSANNFLGQIKKYLIGV